MNTTWIIEKDIINPKTEEEILSVLRKHAIPHKRIRIVPFIHKIDGKMPVPDTKNVILYGSIGVAEIAKEQNWTPGVFHDESTFNQEAYVKHVGDLMLNPDLHICMIQDAKQKAIDLGWNKFFIKPYDDNKEFAGMMIEVEKFDTHFSHLKDIGYIRDLINTKVVISSPKDIGNEWRTVVVGDKISSMSLYKAYQQVYTKREMKPEVVDIVMKAHAKFKPSDVYVIDVCECDLGYKVIEYGTFNSAGLYALDVEKLILDITDFVNGK